MKKPLTLNQVSSLGGIARAKKLSSQRRIEIAKKAAQARLRIKNKNEKNKKGS